MNKVIALLLLTGFSVFAQVDYNENGSPWNRKTNNGPDSMVPGWYYNLGITGIRAELVQKKPNFLLVRYVFKKSPGYGKVKAGDLIIGAGGKEFKTAHQDGYGMEVFGPRGPIEDFAKALDAAQGWSGKGSLSLKIMRGGNKSSVKLNVGTKYGDYAKTYPLKCKKTEKITKELLAYLVKAQQPNGSFGHPVDNLYTPLALLASGNSKYMRAVKKNVYHQAEITREDDKDGGLVNWRYMTAGIVLSEYYLKTRDRKILKELQEIHDFLIKSQYTDMSQINKNDPLGNPDRPNPKDAKKAHGGWGHNMGYEGYGPIGMITGEGALAFALMKKCGIKVNQERHEKAYEFLARGTGKNGYTWYADSVANHNKYADMGRTGASGIANWLSPYSDSKYKKKALLQAKCIGTNPLSFPDTHASPILGMGFTALAANTDQSSIAKLMKANKWWFTLSQCYDGTFYYQPNRDNAGYGGNSRLSASAVTALIFQMHKKTLAITGRK